MQLAAEFNLLPAVNVHSAESTRAQAAENRMHERAAQVGQNNGYATSSPIDPTLLPNCNAVQASLKQ